MKLKTLIYTLCFAGMFVTTYATGVFTHVSSTTHDTVKMNHQHKVTTCFNYRINVNGMVCDICAKGIDKKLNAEKATGIDIDLENGLVSFKTHTLLTDKKIIDLMTNAGYSVEKITRTNTCKPS